MARRRSEPGGFSQRDYQAMAGAFSRLDRRAQIIVVAVLAVALAVGAFVHYRSQQRQVQQTIIAAGSSQHLLLGNPSNATPDPANRENYLLLKPWFAISYNERRGTPNWVGWSLTSADLGDAPRKLDFDADTSLPAGFYTVRHQDYSGSGFDRGHLCPHSDRAANELMSFSTFVMTNIIPQAPNVNQKAWAQLEDYARDLVRKEHLRLYIIAGPSGTGGIGSAGMRETIANGKVTVPAMCWKIIVAVPETGGGDDLAQIDSNARVIAVIMPNDNNVVGDDWARFRTTVSDVERQTGYHFFDKLPPPVAEAMRAKIDTVRIAPPRPKEYKDHRPAPGGSR